MNPFLPFAHCVPDGEAHVFDGRCYLYGSYDIPGDCNYCSHIYHAFSAPVDDLTHWTDHGVIFASRGPEAQVSWTDARLYAPDVASKNGMYYLFFCTGDGTEGVAISRSPAGPFTDAKRLHYPPEINGGGPLVKNDPAVLVDDDGSAYIYWGESHVQAARLKDSMDELDPDTYMPSLIDDEGFGYHEGISIRKFNGKYYLPYCSIRTGRANTLDYAVGDHPLGPFQYGGSIINNVDCDPESWNIHGSLAEINGSHYIFYHRSSNHNRFSRRACVERIFLDDTGHIAPVAMSSAGFDAYLPATDIIPAIAACQLSGGCYFTMEDYTPILTNIHAGDYAVFRPIQFPDSPIHTFFAMLRGKSTGCLSVHLDSPHAPALCQISVCNANERWEKHTVSCPAVTGSHAVYLCFTSDSGYSICDVSRIQFQ